MRNIRTSRSLNEANGVDLPDLVLSCGPLSTDYVLSRAMCLFVYFEQCCQRVVIGRWYVAPAYALCLEAATV